MPGACQDNPETFIRLGVSSKGVAFQADEARVYIIKATLDKCGDLPLNMMQQIFYGLEAVVNKYTAFKNRAVNLVNQRFRNNNH